MTEFEKEPIPAAQASEGCTQGVHSRSLSERLDDALGADRTPLGQGNFDLISDLLDLLDTSERRRRRAVSAGLNALADELGIEGTDDPVVFAGDAHVWTTGTDPRPRHPEDDARFAVVEDMVDRGFRDAVREEIASSVVLEDLIGNVRSLCDAVDRVMEAAR